MDDGALHGLRGWLVDRGLAGDGELELLEGFCERCNAAGLVLARGLALIDTLHPVYEGRVFSWGRDVPSETPVAQYGPSSEGEGLEQWRQSPFYTLLESGADEMRRRLWQGENRDFPVLADLSRQGDTDYLAMIQRFSPERAIGEMDCFISRWTTDRQGGFLDDEVAALRELVPLLGLAVKSASLRRVAESLVETYLGRDAGQRVLQGKMSRGVVEKINAALWFSDMRGYTTLSETIASDQLIPLLDDYAEAVITAIHGAGGDVLKLIGDGILAIFTADSAAEACSCALRAEAELRGLLATLNARRAAEERPTTLVYLGLHIGDVFYGNIGSRERLDFTVVGQAVNEVARIASLCRSVDRNALVSSEFSAALPEEDRRRLVSVGRYALRGVRRAQDLYTVDIEMPDAG